jgi:hypothetical protein
MAHAIDFPPKLSLFKNKPDLGFPEGKVIHFLLILASLAFVD